MWYRKSVLLSMGTGCVEIKIDEKMQKILFVQFYLEILLGLESEFRPIRCLNIFSLWQKNQIKIFCVCSALQIAPFSS